VTAETGTSCRHCHEPVVPCTGQRGSFCKGWKHAAFLHYGPVGAHYCEGRSINPVAELEDRPAPAVPAQEEQQ
jgi:hypothetical protein